jgi:hypothetical protein
MPYIYKNQAMLSLYVGTSEVPLQYGQQPQVPYIAITLND